MSEFMFTKPYEHLRKYAVMENCPILYSMLQSYNHNPERWETPEHFLADTIMALSAALSGTQAQLVASLSRLPPMNLCSNCGQHPGYWK